MKQAFRIAGFALAAIVVAGVTYEAWRVFDARARTPDLIAQSLKNTDPDIARLTPRRIEILLTVEDPTFWTNDGIDLASRGAGATTISQALGKRIYFENFGPGLKKIELMLMTKYALVPLTPKRVILTAFLNRAWMSRDDKGPIYGFAEAARRFHGKELSQLSDDEYLSLVAMLHAPGAMNPLQHPAENAERVARIKRLLAHRCAPDGMSDVSLKGCAA